MELIKTMGFKIEVFNMGESNNKTTNCREKMLKFINNWQSVKSLDVIIDIYDEIRYSGIDKKTVKQKYFRILYNLKESNSLHSLLGEEDKVNMESFLNEFLGMQYDGEKYYLMENCFNELSLDEFYQVLIEAKYLKERENNSEKELSL